MATIPVTTPFPGVTLTASTSDDVDVYDGGFLTVNSGVTVSGYILVHDGGDADVFGTTTKSIVTSTGLEFIEGSVASGIVVDGGFEAVADGGTSVGTVAFSGGIEFLNPGTTSVETVLGTGGIQEVFGTSIESGPGAVLTDILIGGKQEIADGLALGTIVRSAGTQIVGSGLAGGGVALENTVLAGGFVNVDSGGLSKFGFIAGFETVFLGGSSIEETVQSGGFLDINQGFAQDAVVQSGGTEEVENGGVNFQDVVLSGGKEFVFSPLSVVNTTIVGGTVQLTNQVAGEVTFDGSGSLVVSGTQMPKTVISAFSPGETINLASVPFDPNGSVTLTAADVLQISEGGTTFDLNLAALPTPGETFFLTSATSGTDIGAHFRSDANDLNGDGTSDILLQNSSGNLSDLFMQNGMQSGGIFSISNPATFGYSVVHDSYSQLALTGDFNGDGTADILLQNGLGNLSDWLLNKNGQVINGISIGNPTTFGYNVVGTGDFNGDGTTDILLQNSAGTLSDWIMKNGKAINAFSIGDPVTFGFNIVGTGDFNGDGTTDILLQNSAGTLSDWLIKNSQVIGAVTIGNPAVFGYHVVGTGDFNGDGTADILLQNSVGNLSDWLLNKNGQVIGAFSIGNPTTFGFNFIGTGDFNGDGTSDILLQNSLGTLSDWIMKNGHVSTALTIGNPATVGGKVA